MADPIIEASNVWSLLGGGALVALIQAAGRAYSVRTERASGIDGVLANALAHEQSSHATTRTELAEARSAESLARMQAATFGAQLEGALEDIEQLKNDRDADRERNADCERRYAEVSERLRKVEKRITPVGTQAIITDSNTDVRVRQPIMSEEVGGVRGQR